SRRTTRPRRRCTSRRSRSCTSGCGPASRTCSRPSRPRPSAGGPWARPAGPTRRTRGRGTRAVGQEWSGYSHQLTQAIERLDDSISGLYELAIGGTAVGTGLNAPPGFGDAVAAEVAEATGEAFVTAG